MALTPAQKDELNGLRTEGQRLQAEFHEAEAHLQDGATELQDVRGDESFAEREVAEFGQAARGRKQGVEGASREGEAFARQIDDLRRQVEITGRNVAASFDLASFLKDEYARNLYADAARAALEAYYESGNAWGEILRVIHAAILRSEAAFLDVRLSASTTFDRPQYLRPSEPRQDGSRERFAQAEAQQKDYDAQVGRINEMAADPYPADKVAEAEANKERADAELADATAQKADHAAGVKTMRTAYDEQRSKLSGLRQELQTIENRMRELQALDSAT